MTPESQVPETKGESPLPAEEDGVTIMIAEDSPVQAVVLRRALEKNGFKVVWAKSGTEARDKIHEVAPRLLITDVEMPGMTGFELCHFVKSDETLWATPVIIVTSLSQPEDIIKGMKSGADGYVTKPYDEKFLILRVRSLLANPMRKPWSDNASDSVEIEYAGKKHVITADKLRILNLLFSTYENAVKQNHELVNAQLELKKYSQKLDISYQESERLLVNILPKKVAKQLKEDGHATPESYEAATVLFTDFKGFTEIAEGLSPRELIKHLDECFTYFDSVVERYNLEKLKTIGDSYMCVGGVPTRNRTHAVDTVLAGLEIQDFMDQVKELRRMQNEPYWELRLGINTGPVVAGVVGEKKFAYDIWGDAVNTASRMESSGATGRVNISRNTHERVEAFFECEYRGKVKAKNKGEIDMYFVNRIRPELAQDDRGRIPNERFEVLYEQLREFGSAG